MIVGIALLAAATAVIASAQGNTSGDEEFDIFLGPVYFLGTVLLIAGGLTLAIGLTYFMSDSHPPDQPAQVRSRQTSHPETKGAPPSMYRVVDDNGIDVAPHTRQRRKRSDQDRESPSA